MGLVEKRILESAELKAKLLKDKQILDSIYELAKVIVDSLNEGGKVLLCGNGGSACDAMHIAGELVGRFQKEREPLAAIALNTDIAVVTAVANDYGYDGIYAREVRGIMKPCDILIGISTSGNSENIYQAVLRAKELGGTTAALLGKNGGKIKTQADYAIVIPSDNTARIQECHIMLGHIICELVEEWKFTELL